jgi:hypothetical protein
MNEVQIEPLATGRDYEIFLMAVEVPLPLNVGIDCKGLLSEFYICKKTYFWEQGHFFTWKV